MAEVFFKIIELDAPDSGTVFGVGTSAAVVDGEMLEIGQDGEGKFGVPGVAAELIGGFGVGFDAGRRLFCLDEEFSGAADAKGVVRRAGFAFDLEGVFVDDVAVLEGDVALVVDVPTEGDEEGVEEFVAQLGFFVVDRGVLFAQLAKAGDKVVNDFRRGHVPPDGDCVVGNYTL